MKKILYSLAFFGILVSQSYADPEGYTKEDLALLKQYQEEDVEKAIGDIRIKKCIAKKIQDGTDTADILSGLRMIQCLSEKHKPHFEKMVMDLLTKKINDPSLSYKEYARSYIFVSYCLRTLGSIRTDSAIQFLLSLIDSVESWPSILREPLLKNKEREQIIGSMRYQAVSSLFELEDEKGKELLIVIEEKIHQVPDDDPQKKYLLRDIDFWKSVYRGELKRDGQI